MTLETREIALAIIFDRRGRVLVARRSAGHLAGLWEFPGGKIADGETPEQAAVRECEEELGARVEPAGYYRSVQYDYDEFSLLFHPIRCALAEGEIPSPLASSELRWADLGELKGWAIPPANPSLIDAITGASGA